MHLNHFFNLCENLDHISTVWVSMMKVHHIFSRLCHEITTKTPILVLIWDYFKFKQKEVLEVISRFKQKPETCKARTEDTFAILWSTICRNRFRAQFLLLSWSFQTFPRMELPQFKKAAEPMFCSGDDFCFHKCVTKCDL